MKNAEANHPDLKISPLALGCNVFGWTVAEKDSFELLDAYLESGNNFLDTADVYSHWAPGNQGGESETILGRWIKARGNRDKIVLATKVGKKMGPGKEGLSAAYIMQAAEASLKRLQTDYIDLYFSHDDDQSTPLEETLKAYERLIGQGKVRAIGASNYSASRLEKAVEVGRDNGLPVYQCLQTLYNLYDRDEFENELEPVCRKHGLSVTTYFSLASGFLTGKYRSTDDLAGRKRSRMVQGYLNDRGFRILDALDKVAEKHHTSPVKVSLAWLMAKPSVTAPIASATNLDQMRELIEAAKLELDEESMRLLDQAGK